jgi:hypothetical protein
VRSHAREAPERAAAILARVAFELVSRAVIARRRARVVALASALPATEVSEVPGQRHLGFAVRGKRYAWLLDDHHGDGRFALDCKASPGTNSALAEVHPERFHLPAYLAKQGWLGLWLDRPAIDWAEVAEVLAEAWTLAAPAKLRAERAGAAKPRARRRR